MGIKLSECSILNETLRNTPTDILLIDLEFSHEYNLDDDFLILSSFLIPVNDECRRNCLYYRLPLYDCSMVVTMCDSLCYGDPDSISSLQTQVK